MRTCVASETCWGGRWRTTVAEVLRADQNVRRFLAAPPDMLDDE
jgi:hypothetical protein